METTIESSPGPLETSSPIPFLNKRELPLSSNSTPNIHLTWQDLWVTVSDKASGGHRPILRGLTGYVQPSEVLAIMGPSGCGKSTLLDSLAGRLDSSTRQKGDILVNGRKQQLAFGTSAYVAQDDALVTTLTVREAVYYSALLQLPDSMQESEKRDRAESTIREMGLTDAIDTRIGGWNVRGLSGGQKRRVSICIEILRRPKLLFLDEPTSGLDSAASYHVMKRIVKLAQQERISIVASIHQPSTEVFELFHNLCLLSNGQTIYFGPTSAANEFFEKNGFVCPPKRNPSDHYLRTINQDFDSDIEQGFGDMKSAAEAINILVKAYGSSDIFRHMKQFVDDINQQGGDSEEDMHHSDSSDGMEDADFSSDEEYLEARHNIRGIRFPNAGEQVPLPQYDKTCDHKSLVFAVGMQFKDFTECKEAIRMWAILNGRNVKWSKSDKQCKIEARCENGCPWRLYASKMNGVATFSIKSFESEHTCVRSFTNRQANCDWLMHVIMHDLKRNSDYPAKDIANDVKLKYDVSVDSRLCYKAKRKALKLIRGTHESHYSKLRSYIAELQRVDKEGVFLLKSYLNANDQPIFQRCYIGFSALKKGFGIGCKKCICFDACFLKTELGGTVLSAVAKDCNNKMFPISWAVVEKENADTWNWFFGMLFENLGIVDGLGWTFMSDKHRGIINGIRKLAPRAEHRHCARHIFANWRKKFRDRKFKLLFWEAVKLTNEAQFKEKLLELKNVSLAAYEAFMEQVPSKFCKSLISQHTRTDCIQNNICETFNSYILKSRDKPIIEMLEDIRKHLMTKRCNMLDNMKSKTDILTPSVRKRLTKLQDGVKYCKLYRASEKKYEVSAFNHSYIVDLSQKECTCRFWTLSGIPCSHALACIFHARDDPNKYVDAFYLRQNCIEAYKHVLSPILDPKEWPIVEGPPILPPSYVKKPGRPKKNRRKDPSEVPKQGQKKLTKTGVKMSCKKCGEIGHNSRTCKVEKIIEPNPKGRRGRPRVPKPAALQEVSRREIRQATQGSGVVNGESGAIYAMHNLQAQSEGSSQRSQVVNETAES